MASAKLECVCGIRYTIFNLSKADFLDRIHYFRGARQKRVFQSLIDNIISEDDLATPIVQKLMRRSIILQQTPDRRLKAERMRYVNMDCGHAIVCDCGRLLNLNEMLFNQIMLDVLVISDENSLYRELI